MGHIKVLVIDDSDDDRFLYRRSLLSSENTTFEVVESEDGEEGINKVIRETPDCVLLDYSLPGRNGIEILKRLRIMEPFLPIVFLTGQGNETLAINAIREGAQNYISKSSISSETLKRTIRLSIEHASMEKKLFEQKQSLEVFTRALAHDLREPIRTIRCFLDILENPDLPSGKVVEYRRFVKTAAEKMDRLIDSVYNLLRADLRRPDALHAACNANAALLSAENNLRALITERGAVISHDILGDGAIYEDQLARVFQNLISNAIQHAKSNVHIHVAREDKEDRTIFKVSDNGPGIADEDKKRLFQPFAKISLNPENLGLGLSICKRTVEAFGGTIFYETEVGIGTTFLIELPKLSIQPDNAINKTIEKEPSPDRHPELDHPRVSVLLVDDSLADIELARYALIEEGGVDCDLLIASSGQEALKLLSRAWHDKRKIDIVLLDINMPGLDGFETLCEIRAKDIYDSIPVFMCTTSSYEGDKAKAERLGARGYLVKPLTIDAFKAAIEV